MTSTEPITARLRLLVIGWALMTAHPWAFSQTNDPVDAHRLTVAERSEFKRTATYHDVMQLCPILAQSDKIRLTTMGHTSQGRPLPLLVIGNNPPASADQLTESQNRDKLVVFALANIHAGEVCGKEALLMLAREFADGQHAELLDDLILLFAPIYNADGNQPMDATNRPGQHGPDGGMGQRANAQGLDLNRDHIKLESPEARGFVKLLTQWDPAIVIDTHTTNGSYHQYTLTYDGPRNAAAPAELISYVRDDFLPEVGRRMESDTGYKSFHYGNFSPDHTRWNTYPAWPRYGTQYVAARGRISILSEAYAYASYRDRVMVTKQFVLGCCQLAAERKPVIRSLLQDEATAWRTADTSHPRPIAIRSEAKPLDRTFTALGYEEDEATQAAPRGTLPPNKREYPDVQFVGVESPTAVVSRPYAYVVPAELTDVIDNLQRHGIQLDVLREDISLNVQSYEILNVDRADQPFQKHRLVEVTTKAVDGEKMCSAGSVVVRTDQRLGRLAILLLEPMSQDGLVTWNFLDASLQPGSVYPIVRLEESTPLPTQPLQPKTK